MAHYDCSRCGGSTITGPNSCNCTEAELREWRNQRLSEQDRFQKPNPERAELQCGRHDYAGPPPCPDCHALARAAGAGMVEEQVERLHDAALAIPPVDQTAAVLGAGANARQPGGDHYATEYQHWDFVVDTGMHYLLGCATKYASRWRKKGGALDLEKCEHYLQKAIECDIFSPRGEYVNHALNRFVVQLEDDERAIVIAIVQGNYEAAAMSVRWLLGTVKV